MNITRTSEKLYMQPPTLPNSKKPHQCVCIYIHVYIPIHTPRIRTRHTHTHTPSTALPPSRFQTASRLHLVLLAHHDYFNWTNSCAAMTRGRNALCGDQRSLEGGLPVCFSLTLGEAPESKGAAAPGTSLLTLPQASCSPTAHAPSQAPRPWGQEAVASPGQREGDNIHKHSPTHPNNKITLQHKGIVSVTR